MSPTTIQEFFEKFVRWGERQAEGEMVRNGWWNRDGSGWTHPSLPGVKFQIVVKVEVRKIRTEAH